MVKFTPSHVQTSLILSQESSGLSMYLCLGNFAGPNPRIYFADWDASEVTCFQYDGRMIFEYKADCNCER